jgi:hypothetical protein
MKINAEREAAASSVTPGKSSFLSKLALRKRYRDDYWRKRDPILNDRLLWRAQTFRHTVHLLPGPDDPRARLRRTALHPGTPACLTQGQPNYFSYISILASSCLGRRARCRVDSTSRLEGCQNGIYRGQFSLALLHEATVRCRESTIHCPLVTASWISSRISRIP